MTEKKPTQRKQVEKSLQKTLFADHEYKKFMKKDVKITKKNIDQEIENAAQEFLETITPQILEQIKKSMRFGETIVDITGEERPYRSETKEEILKRL